MAAASARVYIGNLPLGTAPADVHAICAPYGRVVAIQTSGPVAFIDFAAGTSTDELISAYNGKDFRGRTITVETARQPLGLDSATVFIVHLPESSTPESLKALAASAGNVASAEVMHNNGALHGKVTFTTKEAALKCVNTLFVPGSELQGFVFQQKERESGNSSSGSRPPRRPARPAGAAAPAKEAPPVEVPLCFLIPIQHAGAIIGQGASILRQILQSSSARIVLESVPQPVPQSYTERIVQIKGSLANVAAAFKQVVEIIDREANKDTEEKTAVPLEILVPEELVGHIIGRAGAQIKAIKALASGAVEIEPCTHPGLVHSFNAYRVLKATGTLEEYAQIASTVHERMTTVVNSSRLSIPDPIKANVESSLVLLLPNSSIGGVIGKGGSVLREINHRSHATVDIDKAPENADDDHERKVTIAGTVEAIELAEHIISSCLPQKGSIKSVLKIPAKAVGHVIGKQGARINDIMSRTHASVKIVQAEGEDTADTIIEGSVMNIVAAQRLVRQIAEDVRA